MKSVIHLLLLTYIICLLSVNASQVSALDIGLQKQSTQNQVRESGSCGSGCSWSLDSSGLLTVTGTSMYSTPWSNYRASITQIAVSTTSILDAAFSGCSQATSAALGSSVRTIGRSAFEGCQRLKSIGIPNSVTSIGKSAFKGCKALTTINLNYVTQIGDDSSSDCVTLFEGCTSLKTIKVGNGNTMFSSVDGYLCSKNTETLLVAPPATEYAVIPDTVKTIGYRAFKDCTSLLAVSIPENVTTIESSAFQGCSKLSYFCYLGSADPCSSSSSVFDGCNQLKSLLVDPNYYSSNMICGKERKESGTCVRAGSSSLPSTSNSSSTSSSSSSLPSTSNSSSTSSSSSSPPTTSNSSSTSTSTVKTRSSGVTSGSESHSKPATWLVKVIVFLLPTVILASMQ